MIKPSTRLRTLPQLHRGPTAWRSVFKPNRVKLALRLVAPGARRCELAHSLFTFTQYHAGKLLQRGASPATIVV
jgi:hypothetical protein